MDVARLSLHEGAQRALQEHYGPHRPEHGTPRRKTACKGDPMATYCLMDKTKGAG